MNIVSANKPVILVLGGTTGLLGQAIVKEAADRGYSVVAAGRNDFSLNDSKSLAACIDRAKPDIVCNTIAYTKVDLAEEEEDNAMHLNRAFPLMLGRVIKSRPHICLMQYSTDFVFNGRKKTPYTPDDETSPQCVYGRSKLAGEKALLELALERCLIIRTAWLFGPGKKNFVQTILGLGTGKNTINVVHDQTGSPTYTTDLAAYSLALSEAGGTGVFHVVNSGQASWCELAAEATRLAQMECTIMPIASCEYPQKATRPAYSVLDTSRFTEVTGITPRPWPQALADYMYSTTSSI